MVPWNKNCFVLKNSAGSLFPMLRFTWPLRKVSTVSFLFSWVGIHQWHQCQESIYQNRLDLLQAKSTFEWLCSQFGEKQRCVNNVGDGCCRQCDNNAFKPLKNFNQGRALYNGVVKCLLLLR